MPSWSALLHHSCCLAAQQVSGHDKNGAQAADSSLPDVCFAVHFVPRHCQCSHPGPLRVQQLPFLFRGILPSLTQVVMSGILCKGPPNLLRNHFRFPTCSSCHSMTCKLCRPAPPPPSCFLATSHSSALHAGRLKAPCMIAGRICLLRGTLHHPTCLLPAPQNYDHMACAAGHSRSQQHVQPLAVTRIPPCVQGPPCLLRGQLHLHTASTSTACRHVIPHCHLWALWQPVRHTGRSDLTVGSPESHVREMPT